MALPSTIANLIKKNNPSYNLPNGGGAYNVLSGTQPTTIPQSVVSPAQAQQAAMSQASGPQQTQQWANTATNPAVVNTTTTTPSVSPETSNPTGAQPTTYTPEQYDALNALIASKLNGAPMGSVGMENGYTGVADSVGLRREMMKDRAQGTGLYSIPKDTYATPEQIMGIRAMADKHYNDLISTASEDEKNKATIKATQPYTISDYSSDPWMQGLVINGLVQGGTAAERKAHEAMLKVLPDEQKQQLIKSSLYNSMSAAERATFDTGDNLGAGVQQIISDQPADFSTNPYKYAAQKYMVYLGGKQDPKYINFKSMVGNLTAPIINQIYGAAVTNSELTRAQEFIPDLATDSTAMAMTKLQHLAGFYDYANAKKLSRKAGVPMTETMDDYISKYDSNYKGKTSASTSGFAENW